jgi:hypothetical protein
MEKSKIKNLKYIVNWYSFFGKVNEQQRMVKGTCVRDWREHEEFSSRKISVPLNRSVLRGLLFQVSAVMVLAFSILIFTFSISSIGARAQVMTSSSYKIESDSVNFGGGHSTSGSYSVEDTAGEIATGDTTSTNFNLHAGYQQIHTIYIAVSATSNVIMSPAIGGVTGGTSNGQTSFTVTTDNPAGYTATIKASSTPAMQSPLDVIADYEPAGANPDFAFTVPATSSAFGFSPEGADIDERFKDDGANCNTGSSDTADACWAGLSTSDQIFAKRTSNNLPNGTQTTLKFRVTSGSAHVQTAGMYVATSTVTILPL